MSWQATQWVMGLGLPLVKGAVLKSLAYHAHKDGSEAHPGIETIAFESGLKERAVQDNLKALSQDGLIAITSDTKGGRKRKTTYQLLMANPAYGDIRNPAPETVFLTTSLKETPHPTTGKGAPHDTALKEGTVIEPSIEKDYAEKENPRWLEILAQDSRWPKGSLNGYVDDIEKAFVGIDLTIEAQRCYDWLNETPKGRSRKRPKAVWTTWLKNESKQPRASPSQSAHKPQVSHDPDPAWNRGQR